MILLDGTDVRMALVAIEYYKRAHILSKRPVPEAARRLTDHLNQALAESPTMASCGHPQQGEAQQLLSTKQLAQRLGCSQRHARRTAARIGRRIGRDWLVAGDAIGEEDTDDDGS
jgi:hypothetical protein